MSSPAPQVHPLRINKTTPSSSPTKYGSSIPRALAELAPTEQRRNSPILNQTSKVLMSNPESSPFQSSPFNASEGNSSPRLFWQSREQGTPSRFLSENAFLNHRSPSPSPTRRSSIERLQRASRVKNSNMFAREHKQEYDPASVPVVERPLAKQIQGNAYGGLGIDGLRLEERGRMFGHMKTQSVEATSTPTKTPLSPNGNGRAKPVASYNGTSSPVKSSLSASCMAKRMYDAENNIWTDVTSDDENKISQGRSLHRHAKSVTFDAAPPQINEYEMVTPDLSSIGTNSRENSYDTTGDDDSDSYMLNESQEREESFDESLEDTDKTPVVGPDDWRYASSVDNDENDGVDSRADNSVADESHDTSSAFEVDTATDHRPLPPLPCSPEKSNSVGLFAAAERASNLARGSSPGVAPASFSKSDIQSLTGGRMPLEERLRLMMLQDDDTSKSAAEVQRERRLRRGLAKDRHSATPEPNGSDILIHEDEDTLADLQDFKLPERISRESILRKIGGHDHSFEDDSEYRFSSPAPEHRLGLDPDVPIPSTEDFSIQEDESVIIKAEDEGSEIDVYSIPELYQSRPDLHDDGNTDELHQQDNDDASEYSTQNELSGSTPDDGPPTPRPTSALNIAISAAVHDEQEKVSLPDFSGFLFSTDLGLQLGDSLSTMSSPPESLGPTAGAGEVTLRNGVEPATNLEVDRPTTPLQLSSVTDEFPKPSYDGSEWGCDAMEEPSTPESVVHHQLSFEQSPQSAVGSLEDTVESPTIPEQVATIKASSGSKLKTRPSVTPSDIMAMREARRIVSGDDTIPPMPPVYQSQTSSANDNTSSAITADGNATSETVTRHPSFAKKSLTLDIGSDLSLALEADFDRVIESQKKGYLMRQNTKLVVASSDVDKGAPDFRATRSAGNSPIKQTRPQSWTVEPWNSQSRKKSVRESARFQKKLATGPVPPLPGQASNATGLNSLTEETLLSQSNEPSAGERGRLFVKVLGVKDLGLQLPHNERTWFNLTLDNGVHCVTTAWLELGRSAPIGQEFELVVPNDLEFQLTLNVKLQKPPPKRVVETPTLTRKPPKPSTFSRVFTSPKKRKELEMRQREEDERVANQRQQELLAQRMSAQPTAWDMLSPLVAEDGSFARSYVCLKDHEASCYGRPYVVDVACFNEWAREESAASSSVKSKRGDTYIQRRAPYKIGKLELQLLFVPKPRSASDEDMPKSMNSCIRQMKEAEAALSRSHEGYLSQQGGDCPYWRRRHFKLRGSKLTAYHESTGQPRATINLANASKLIDDKRTLTQKETTGRNGSRRKSGFAEEEEGYMFVEEGFRIRFANGEVIDFYADTAKDKEGWMKVLDQCIGTTGESAIPGWCELVLKGEEGLQRADQRKESSERPSRYHARTKSMAV